MHTPVSHCCPALFLQADAVRGQLAQALPFEGDFMPEEFEFGGRAATVSNLFMASMQRVAGTRQTPEEADKMRQELQQLQKHGRKGALNTTFGAAGGKVGDLRAAKREQRLQAEAQQEQKQQAAAARKRKQADKENRDTRQGYELLAEGGVLQQAAQQSATALQAHLNQCRGKGSLTIPQLTAILRVVDSAKDAQKAWQARHNNVAPTKREHLVDVAYAPILDWLAKPAPERESARQQAVGPSEGVLNCSLSFFASHAVRTTSAQLSATCVQSPSRARACFAHLTARE